ncbi:MAG TPA: tripartite tricarboxylate transporter substrate binding protein, partial [Burkholderiales bacterium]|nr:tripartite tricarboxylate transporter substrate binding protein [Burkholderiales bacterium]
HLAACRHYNVGGKKMPRNALVFCIACLVLSGVVMPTFAQNYPNRAVRIIAPFPPGGGLDIVARALGQKLALELKQPVVIDNRAGADGMIGSEQVARAAPDGYTLLVSSTGPMVINPALNATMPYDTVKDFAPITLVVVQPMFLVVHPSLPAKSVKELIALAKARPGQLNYASGGVGNGAHLAGEIFRSLTSIDIVHIPYKGAAPAVVDLLAGQAHMMLNSVSVLLPHINAGKLRALAVGAPHRMALLPNVPTMKEAGVADFDASSWYGFFAPAATPREIVARLNTEAVKILRSQEMRDYLEPQGAEPIGNTPEQFSAHIRAELAKWARAVKSAGVKPH